MRSKPKAGDWPGSSASATASASWSSISRGAASSTPSRWIYAAREHRHNRLVTQADLQQDNPPDPAMEAARLASRATAGHFDELRDPQGALRPLWAEFFGHLGPGAFADFDRRAAQLARQVREDGITYNVY